MLSFEKLLKIILVESTWLLTQQQLMNAFINIAMDVDDTVKGSGTNWCTPPQPFVPANKDWPAEMNEKIDKRYVRTLFKYSPCCCRVLSPWLSTATLHSTDWTEERSDCNAQATTSAILAEIGEKDAKKEYEKTLLLLLLLPLSYCYCLKDKRRRRTNVPKKKDSQNAIEEASVVVVSIFDKSP